MSSLSKSSKEPQSARAFKPLTEQEDQLRERERWKPGGYNLSPRPFDMYMAYARTPGILVACIMPTYSVHGVQPQPLLHSLCYYYHHYYEYVPM